MAHLGADVAAFVDGQLSDSAMGEVAAHLDICDSCAQAVRQQRLLKTRMSTVSSPDPPAELVRALSGLASSPPARPPWWVRVGRSMPFRTGVVLASASLVVVATAFVVGGSPPRPGDEVVPPFERYAADFFGPTATADATVITEATLDRLGSSGWSCHQTLAGDLHRVSGAYADSNEVIALTYSNGQARLNLFEQVGVLDLSELDGFELVQIAGGEVWVRPGEPAVLTWDEDGTVYTIVTDADPVRIEQVVKQLPTGSYRLGVTDRIGEGLNRMASWVDAA